MLNNYGFTYMLSKYSGDSSGFDFPEGPVFDKDGNLWVVELKGGHLCMLNNSELLRVSVGGAPNGMTIDDQNKLWICDSAQNAIRRYSINNSQWDTIITEVDGHSLNNPNDLAFDRKRNLHVAVFDKKYIKVVYNDGYIINEIKLIGSRPTNCTFVSGKCCIVVTEAEKGDVLHIETEFLGAKLFENSFPWK